MPFEHDVTVRFFEVDRAGILFLGRVIEHCHATFEELLATAGHDLESHFSTSSWGMPLVHAEADFIRPMRMGDRLRVSLRVERLGGRSITFAYAISGAEDGALRARAFAPSCSGSTSSTRRRTEGRESLPSSVRRSSGTQQRRSGTL